MAETCINGHTRTEENTSWVKDKTRYKLRRRCLDCKRGKYLKGGLAAHERSMQITAHRHEDLEDLLEFGATYNEIMERSGFHDWSTMLRSLKLRDRQDLIDAIREKRAAA